MQTFYSFLLWSKWFFRAINVSMYYWWVYSRHLFKNYFTRQGVMVMCVMKLAICWKMKTAGLKCGRYENLALFRIQWFDSGSIILYHKLKALSISVNWKRSLSAMWQYWRRAGKSHKQIIFRTFSSLGKDKNENVTAKQNRLYDKEPIAKQWDAKINVTT